ncbi:isocitrate/isopropylmalate dehydrogenase family protein [Rhodobacteraceae bacterium N5(2021)]|uniref:Isocitrate/isopropylmalate dehydrogenase family protein n=1 Tax=Gymnodinialimonas phycosphaerae TaxID=2841589 RepID=A0A975TY91_9RHOB|nr:isocitrate/isopropylmalate dehydrogenase family protein [Gymnodinialimonas phycosphaerae]MBY4892194.1 isocitrate/isopropylmalate dehydrogenase family protein [Gymnodinialimonas phycosphaerae]
MTLRLLALPGDGIGPEITEATCAVVRAALNGVQIDVAQIGFAALEAAGTTIPEKVIAKARAADGVILGPVSHNAYPPVADGGLNPSGVLRKQLALFANIRPARSHPAVPTPTGHAVDMVVVRENLEGFYADRNMESGPAEFMPVPGVALSMRRITEANSRAIAEAGYALARRRGSRRVAVIHKANVLRLSDGLFLDTVRDVARNYPEIETDELLIDAAAALFVRDPTRFDVVIATNMYGDILSDLASELAGGLGLAASLNHGADHAVAQAQHGSAPDLAGQGVANPGSLIGSAAMLLDHLGQPDAAALIQNALFAALCAPATRTPDLGGAASTAAMTDAILTHIEQAKP